MRRKIKRSVFNLYRKRVERRERKKANQYIAEQRRQDMKLMSIERSRLDRSILENQESAKRYQEKVHDLEKLFRDVSNIDLSKLKIEHHAIALFQELNKMRDIADELSRQISKNKLVVLR